MSNDKLWAPWRLGYIKGQAPLPPPRAADWLEGADEGCFLCRVVAEWEHPVRRGTDAEPLRQIDRDNLVLQQGGASVTVMNRYPYNNGHLLIAPRRHVARLDELSPSEQLEIGNVSARMVAVLEREINAQGFNLGLNLGSVAGAGVPGHLHWHLVPRWSGDVNFMPVIAGIDIIPQALDELWQVLRAALEAGSEAS